MRPTAYSPSAATRWVVWLALAAWPALTLASIGDSQEPRQRLDTSASEHRRDVALTLDACGGAYDADLIAALVKLRVPTTVFVTRKWLRRHPQGLRELQAHPDIFELENHGAEHVPALVGQSLYGMRGPPDLAGVEHEISGGAQAVLQATGRAPRWYRGAGARYDTPSLQLIERLDLRVAGYSLNADDGAKAPVRTVMSRLRQTQPGDIILAHMNRPAGYTAEGLVAVLPELLERHLRFVRLSQAAGVQSWTPPAASTRRMSKARQP